MSQYYILLSTTLITAALPVVFGALRYRSLDKPSRIIFLLFVLAFLTECIAAIVARIFHNNLMVYNLFNLAQAFLLALYFNYCVVVFRKWNVGWYVAVFGVLVGILNFYLQPITTYNSNYFLYMALLTFIMGFFLFFQLMTPGFLKIYRNPHFWILLLLIFFNVLNFFGMALYDYLTIHLGSYKGVIDTLISYTSSFCNIGFAALFLFYTKIKASNA